MKKKTSCLLFHKWDGCKCSKCGDVRDSNHSFSWVKDYISPERYCYEKCSKCGKTLKKMEHDFKRTAGQCYLVCSRCGSKSVLPEHQFQNIDGQCMRRCKVCGYVESIPHTMKGRKSRDGSCEQYCTVCGYTKAGHVWHHLDGCKCDICGEINSNGRHEWTIITEGNFTDIKVCDICGMRDESEKCTIEASKNRRKMQEAMERSDSLHDMRAKGIKC